MLCQTDTIHIHFWSKSSSGVTLTVSGSVVRLVERSFLAYNDRHVNNVKYARFFESGRMKWAASIGEEVGGSSQGKDMMLGKGISLILKSIDIKFKKPVTYPDTLLIAHKPHSLQPTQFNLQSIAYSYLQRRVVTESNAVIVWYDYDEWQKCVPPTELASAVQRRTHDCSANKNLHELSA